MRQLVPAFLFVLITVSFSAALLTCRKGPIVKVTQADGRVTRVVAHIHNYDLNTGSEPTDKTRSFARSHGCSTDDAGHIIADRLGGCGDAEGNIFPQDPHINRGQFRMMESTVAEAAGKLKSRDDFIRYTVELKYADKTKTRPYIVRYQIERVESGKKPVEIAASWFPNPKGKNCGKTT